MPQVPPIQQQTWTLLFQITTEESVPSHSIQGETQRVAPLVTSASVAKVHLIHPVIDQKVVLAIR